MMSSALRFLRPIAALVFWAFCSIAASAQNPAWEWAHTPGTESYTRQMITDAAGNVYVSGTFSGTATFGATTLTSSGDYDIFIAKLDRAGTYQWAVQAGSDVTRANDPFSDVNESATGLALDGNGNLYVTGFFSGEMGHFGPTTLINPFTTFIGFRAFLRQTFVAKLTAAGQWQWAIAAGNQTSDQGNGITVDPLGNVYVMGSFIDSMAFGTHTLTGNSHTYVAKLNSNRTWDWAVSASSSGFESGYGLAADAAGNLYVCGIYGSNGLTFGAITLPPPPGGNNLDGFVVKLTSNGIWSWATNLGGTGDDYASALAVDLTGQVYVTGNFGGPSATFGAFTLTNRSTNPVASRNDDAYVAKLSPTGVWQWAVSGGGDGPGDDSGRALALDAAGNVTVAGQFGGPATFGSTILTQTSTAPGDTSDVFVAKLTPTGNWLWAASGGGSGLDVAFAVAPDGNDAVYVAGQYSRGNATFGTTTLPNTSTNPFLNYAFTARLNTYRLGVGESATPTALRAYPNPAHGTLQVPLPAQFSGALTLLDATGRTVRFLAVTAGAAAVTMDLHNVPPGLYVLRAGAAGQRVVVE